MHILFSNWCTFVSPHSLQSSWVSLAFSADPLCLCPVGWEPCPCRYSQVLPNMFDLVWVSSQPGWAQLSVKNSCFVCVVCLQSLSCWKTKVLLPVFSSDFLLYTAIQPRLMDSYCFPNSKQLVEFRTSDNDVERIVEKNRKSPMQKFTAKIIILTTLKN